MKVSFRVEGLKELEASLQELEKDSTRKTVARNTLKKAAAPIAAAMTANAPTNRGQLRRSITVGTKLKGNVGDAAYAKAMRAGLGKSAAVIAKRAALRAAKGTLPPMILFVGPSVKAPHAHLVEFGTAPHVNGGLFAGSQHPGTAPRPFVRPAWDASKDRALSIITEELRAQIAKAVARQAKAAAKRRARG